MVSINVPVMILLALGAVMAIISWWKQKKYEKEFFETGKSKQKYSGWIFIFAASIAIVILAIIAQIMSWIAEYL